jgi:hypothetical protein
MSEQPTEQQVPTDSDTQEGYGWGQVAQEMHAWHPGLQEHARRHLEDRGLLHLVTSIEAEADSPEDIQRHDQSPQHTMTDTPRVKRLTRPTAESKVDMPIETMIVTDPEGIPVSDVLTDDMKKMPTEEFIFGHGIDKATMELVDRTAGKLYDFCAAIMKEDIGLRKYALATFVARGLNNIHLDEDGIYLLMQAPAIAEQNGLSPAEYSSWGNISDALAEKTGVDGDNFYEKFQIEASTSIDPENTIADRLRKELLEDLDDDPGFPESELGSTFEYGDDSAEEDTLDMLTVLQLDKGNIYYKRLLLKVFSEASSAEAPIDVVEYYEAARSMVEQKIKEGIIPPAFSEKLRLYHPSEYVYEDKMTAILNGNEHAAGYYQGEVGRFAIVEDYRELLPIVEEATTPVTFREPGTEDQYDETSDYKFKVAIHELFHHLSGHSFVEIGDKIDNRKVGLGTGSWGRMLNEAVTERLASLVYPQADQAYGEERAFLQALQVNSDGSVTDELLYDAYLEEREEGGLPHLKKLIQTVGEAYGQKGFIQRVDKVFEDEGYHAAIDYLRHATEAMGRQFVDPLGSNKVAA